MIFTSIVRNAIANNTGHFNKHHCFRFIHFFFIFYKGLLHHTSVFNLDRGSSKDQIIFKPTQQFLTRFFLKFSLHMYRKNWPHPLAAMLMTDQYNFKQAW